MVVTGRRLAPPAAWRAWSDPCGRMSSWPVPREMTGSVPRSGMGRSRPRSSSGCGVPARTTSRSTSGSRRRTCSARPTRGSVRQGGAASARDHQVPDDPAVRQLARQALAVATETAPALARHPDVGRPRASDADIADLEQLTAAT